MILGLKKNAEPSMAPDLGGLPITEGTPGKILTLIYNICHGFAIGKNPYFESEISLHRIAIAVQLLQEVII
jgi:hypothetical protein